MDALGVAANNAGNAPQLLFHTKFSGLTIGTAYYGTAQTDWHQDFVDSVDDQTGYDIVNDIKGLYGSGTTIDLHTLPQANIPDAATFATYFGTDITTQLELSILDQHGTYPTYTRVPQTYLRIFRPYAEAAANDINEACFVGRFKLPAGLDLQTGNTAAGRYLVLKEIKTGGYGGVGGVGDLRFKLELTGSNGYNEWTMTVDNSANGIGVIPNNPSAIPPIGSSLTVYYQNKSGVEAELNVWSTFYLYFNRQAGRLIAAIHTDNGSYDVIANAFANDFPGGQIYGQERLPITRLHGLMLYTATTYPCRVYFNDWQIWNKPPIELV